MNVNGLFYLVVAFYIAIVFSAAFNTVVYASVVLKIRLLDYYDYVNKGVKGVKSSRNAPSSPYQYKNLGMSQDGRASLRKYIESGRAKINVAQNQKGVS